MRLQRIGVAIAAVAVVASACGGVGDDGSGPTGATGTTGIAHPTGADEVVLVTSRWHAARAGAAFRLLLLRRPVRVTTAYPPEPFDLRAGLGELPLWL